MAVPKLPPRDLRPLVCRYKPCTQNGNWFEDRYRKDDCVRDFLRRRERGELMIQKADAIISQLLAPVRLLPAVDGNIWIGDSIQLRCPGVVWAAGGRCNQVPEVALSANVFDIARACPTQLTSPTAVCASLRLEPCARNVFTVTRPDGSVSREVLRYGQPFSLRLQDGYPAGLYLTSEPPTAYCVPPNEARQQAVQLTQCRAPAGRWVAHLLENSHRMEAEGSPVPAGSPLLVCHQPSGQTLRLEAGHPVTSLLSHEWEVTAHATTDSRRRPLPENRWCLSALPLGAA
ncbi:cilia- and flagella-associated protein 161-like [Amphibalanus amphitrite]|uniref:cilia- and flagella-associated protein 161-like n=1 Tax=Amphibalanus amphitrite TaxID=1232801 RepID=UPI001C90C35C|nr:cilia- and flagella-associated protein 161-like [Amphibalanus amphitrite]